MGYYLEAPTNLGKAKHLIDTLSAERTAPPESFDKIPADKALICVVNNGLFEAAGYCYSPAEMEVFAADDGRPKEWLLAPLDKVRELSGYRG